jgi:N-acyl-D-aspartate/D-glutamate deacylase
MGAFVLRGGTVIDGTGAPGVAADVAVDGDRVVAVGSGLDAPTGAHEIDAGGLVVAPGFVDVHTHYDAQVFWDPACTPSGQHGVTTVVAGNCGFSIAPCKPEHRGLLARTLENVEGMSLEALEAGIAWEFETYGEYLAAVERRGTYMNFGGYVGHTAVRVYVMGDDAYERDATDDEIARMREVVADSVAAGALGFATSSSMTHAGDAGRPVPSRFASHEEVNALAGVLAEMGRGVFAIIPGERVTHRDVYNFSRDYTRPITWTALLTGPSGWHETMAGANATARAEGADVWPQVSCRPLQFQMTFAAPFPFDSLPVFAELLSLPADERAARYRDPSWRATARPLVDKSYTGSRWHVITIEESVKHPEANGRTVHEVAAESGRHPLDVALDIALDDQLTTRFRVVVANDNPDGIAYLLQQPGMLLGLSDAGAHVSQLCDACMPTDLLGNWVREKGVLSLEQAVHKMTLEPATVFGLRDRGVLRAGAVADIAVFDAASVAPGKLRRVYDLPAGADRLTADEPVGMAHVFVNGMRVVADGRPQYDTLDERPGTVVRS